MLTSTSTVPTRPARSTSWDGSLRSAAMNRAAPPSALIVPTTAEPRTGSRPCTITSAPCRPSSSAAAFPMPDVAPVTRAPKPSRSRCRSICRLSLCRCEQPNLSEYLNHGRRRAGRGIRRVTALMHNDAAPSAAEPVRCGGVAGKTRVTLTRDECSHVSDTVPPVPPGTLGLRAAGDAPPPLQEGLSRCHDDRVHQAIMGRPVGVGDADAIGGPWRSAGFPAAA